MFGVNYQQGLTIDAKKSQSFLELAKSVQAHVYAEGYDESPRPLILDYWSLKGLVFGHAFLIARNHRQIDQGNPLFVAAKIAHVVLSQCLMVKMEKSEGWFGIDFYYQRALILSFVKLLLMEIDNGFITVTEACKIEIDQLKQFFSQEILNISSLLVSVKKQDPNQVVYFSLSRENVVRVTYPRSLVQKDMLKKWVPPSQFN